MQVYLTLKYTSMNTKEISEKKKDLKLSERQRELIVGLLLGDGHLETQNGGGTDRVKGGKGAAEKQNTKNIPTKN